MKEVSPLIVTLALDKPSAHYFTSLRQQYFPPAINYLQAHLTLFHHLPPSEPVIYNDLLLWSNSLNTMLLKVSGIKTIGRGVAFTLDSSELVQLHQTMQAKWKAWLIPQDRQKLWPHITIQNKVASAVANETAQTLQASFRPFTVKGTGFQVWSYEGGPWKFMDLYPFRCTVG